MPRSAAPPVTGEDEQARLEAEMSQRALTNFRQLPLAPPGGQAVVQLPEIPVTGSIQPPKSGPSPALPSAEPSPITVGQPIDAMDLVRTPQAMPSQNQPAGVKPGIDPDKALLYAVLLNQVRRNMETGTTETLASPFGVPQNQLQAALVQRLLAELNPASPVNTAIPTTVVPVNAAMERMRTVDASQPVRSGQPKQPKGR